MPNIKSAKKRVLVTEKKTLQNKAVKSALKTQIKKFLTAVESGNKEEATKLYPETVSAIDAAASKGVIHKNNARRNGRLTLWLLFYLYYEYAGLSPDRPLFLFFPASSALQTRHKGFIFLIFSAFSAPLFPGGNFL